jgi:hypothetical protein
MSTTTGAADDEPGLTEEQRETLRRAFSSPAWLQQAESTFSALNKQMSSTILKGFSPVLEKWRDQQRQLAQAVMPLINTQAQIQIAMAPVIERTERFQREMASSLSVPIMANAQFQTWAVDMAEALQRINDVTAVKLAMPTEDGFRRLSDLVEGGEIDEETLGVAEQGIAADVELSAAIDSAAEILAKSKPFISRKRARQIIIFWVWLMFGSVLYVVAVLTTPALAAVPAAFGLSAPAGAKVVSNKLFPPEADEAHDKED